MLCTVARELAAHLLGREPGQATAAPANGTQSSSSLAPPPLPPELLAERRSVPCLVATGRHDVFLPPQRVAPAAQRHLGAVLHVLEGSGHLLLDESPDEIVTLVTQALAAASRDTAQVGRNRP